MFRSEKIGLGVEDKTMADIIVIITILAIVAAAIAKIVIEKRKGNKCIGCPHGQTGGSRCDCMHSGKKSKG